MAQSGKSHHGKTKCWAPSDPALKKQLVVTREVLFSGGSMDRTAVAMTHLWPGLVVAASKPGRETVMEIYRLRQTEDGYGYVFDPSGIAGSGPWMVGRPEPRAW